jgi:hypothetical protein
MPNWKFFLNGTEVEEPIGWDSVEFRANRLESHGIDQEFSTELTFYGLGAKILKAEFDANFINSDTTIIIQQIANGEVKFTYRGAINYSVYSETNNCKTGDNTILVGIQRDIFTDKFKSRLDNEIDLMSLKDMDGNEVPALNLVPIRTHSQPLPLVANGGNQSKGTDQTIFMDATFPYTSNGWSRDNFCKMTPVYWDSTDFKGALFGNTNNTSGYNFDITNCIFVNNGSTTRYFKLDVGAIQYKMWWLLIQWYASPIPFPFPPEGCSMNITLTAHVVDSGGNDVSLDYLWDSPLCYITDDYPPHQEICGLTNPVTANVTIPVGGKLLLYFQWGGNGNIVVGTNYYGTPSEAAVRIQIGSDCNGNDWKYRVRLSEISESTASITNVVYIEDYLRRLIYLMTGNPDGLVSNTFSVANQGCYHNNALTTGMLLRNISLPNGATTQIKTSFKSIFESLDAIFCLGWGLELSQDGSYKVRIEEREYFYSDFISETFTNPSEVKITANAEKMYSNFLIGYKENWKNVALGGSVAVHSYRSYTIPNNAIQDGGSSKLEALSEIIGEGVAIEYSRRLNLIEATAASSDQRNDYETFIIWLNPTEFTGGYLYYLPTETEPTTFAPLQASASSGFSDTDADDIGSRYNLLHSPRRMAMRHYQFVASNFFGLPNKTLIFNNSEYQADIGIKIYDYFSPVCSILESEPNTFLYEDSNLQQSDIVSGRNTPILKPVKIEVEFPQAFCDFITMVLQNQYQKIRIVANGVDYQGYINSVTNMPEDSSNGGKTKFTLFAYDIGSPQEGGAPPPPQIGPYNDSYNNAYL